MAKLNSWELFSDEQITDANKAMRMILTQIPVISLDDKLFIIFELSKLMASQEMPTETRIAISECILITLKAKLTIKALL